MGQAMFISSCVVRGLTQVILCTGLNLPIIQDMTALPIALMVEKIQHLAISMDNEDRLEVPIDEVTFINCSMHIEVGSFSFGQYF